MKANFILGKKQIILASLVVILGAAIYLNWQFASSGAELDAADPVNAELASSEPTPGAPAEQPAAARPESGPAVSGGEADPANAAVTPENPLDSPANSQDAGANDPKMLGDAKFVSAQAIANETYFSEARLARNRSRDEAIETVSTILDSDRLTESDKQLASQKAVALSDLIEAESRIENLVKAKGFSDCMAYLTDSTADIVVKTDGLTQDQATQIKNLVVAEGKIRGENVSITEIN